MLERFQEGTWESVVVISEQCCGLPCTVNKSCWEFEPIRDAFLTASNRFVTGTSSPACSWNQPPFVHPQCTSTCGLSCAAMQTLGNKGCWAAEPWRPETCVVFCSSGVGRAVQYTYSAGHNYGCNCWCCCNVFFGNIYDLFPIQNHMISNKINNLRGSRKNNRFKGTLHKKPRSNRVKSRRVRAPWSQAKNQTTPEKKSRFSGLKPNASSNFFALRAK